MFGTYRLFLALVVAISHIRPDVLPSAGVHAVFAFYVLSGYLMTLVLHESYGFSARGIRHFLTNRALRIYPSYLVALVATVVVFCAPLLWHGRIHPRLADVPWTKHLSELLLIDFTGGSDMPRWIPPAWSLDVEVAYYVAMALLLARSRTIIVLWAGASLAHLVYLMATDASFFARYVTIAAASLPFSAGSLIYAFHRELPRPTRVTAALCALALAANMLIGVRLWPDPLDEGFNASLALAVLCTAFLRDPGALAVSPRWRRIDAWLGDLAYPVFLCHYAVGLLVTRMVPRGTPHRWDIILGLALVGSLVIAWLMHRAIEKPLAAVRDRVRGSLPPR